MPAGGLPYPEDPAVAPQAAPEQGRQPVPTQAGSVPPEVEAILSQLAEKYGIAPEQLMQLMMQSLQGGPPSDPALQEIGPPEVSQQANANAGVEAQIKEALGQLAPSLGGRR